MPERRGPRGPRLREEARSHAQFRAQEPLHHLGAGLAFGLLHHLPDKEAEGGLLAGAEVGDDLGIGFQGGIDEGLQRGGVGDLPEPAFADDGFGVSALLEEFGKEGLGGGAVDGFGLQQA